MPESKQKAVSPAAVSPRVRANWKPVTAVLVGGLLAGMALGALQSERSIESYGVVAAQPLAGARGPAKPSSNTSEELVTLQARNRRLEALVTVLRDRRHTH